MHFVYILRCADNSLYIGETPNVATRLAKHNEGSASKLHRQASPRESWCSPRNTLIAPRRSSVSVSSRDGRAAKKDALVAGDFALLRRL